MLYSIESIQKATVRQLALYLTIMGRRIFSYAHKSLLREALYVFNNPQLFREV
jgi:hypothetical protein